MDKSDIFTAQLILIFSLVIDISRYFHCRVWITSDVSIHLTSLNVPNFRNSNAYFRYSRTKTQSVGIYFLIQNVRNNVVPKLFVFSKNFGFCIFTACFVNRKMPVYCIK